MKKIFFGVIVLLILIYIGYVAYPKYLNMLKRYPDYSHEPVNVSETFRYTPRDDQNLMALKATYHLEQIAGAGDEISKIINLMNWVHRTLRHSGSAKNPEPRNALHILEVCQGKKQAVNCRMIAIVLNEVYLAMGFYSRFVTCMPVEETFRDCHVINLVYSNTFHKWIYMDASFNVYFRDENGNFLSIQEVRERMCTDKPLIINDDLNWNGLYYPKFRYLRYMNKNLFRFSCPMSSEFNYESSDKPRTYIELNPKNYHSKKGAIIGNQVTTYFVSNPDFFWALPEIQ